jgi:vacuolar protein 8
MLVSSIRQLATSRQASPSSSVGTPRSARSPARSHSYQETDTDGQGEIQLLARRILEYTDGNEAELGMGMSPPPRGDVGSSVEGGSSIHDHEELRRSVKEAFSGSYKGR